MTELAGFELNGKHYALRKNGGWLSGIDVSHHQKVGAYDLAPHSFVIVRACYGDNPDKLYAGHVNFARAAGKKVGAYLFYRQTENREDQLAAFLRTVGAAGKLDIAPVVDIEWDVLNGKPTPVEKERHNTDGRWITEQLAERFGQAIVYTAAFFWRDKLGAPDWVGDHALWLAHYTKPGWPAIPSTAPMPMKHWAIHQFQGAPLDTNVCQYLPLCSRVPDTEPAPPP